MSGTAATLTASSKDTATASSVAAQKIFAGVHSSKFRHIQGSPMHRSTYIESIPNLNTTISGDCNSFQVSYMSVCLSVHVCVSLCVYECLCTFMHVHVTLCACACACMHYTHAHRHTCAHTDTRKHTHASIHTHISLHAHICVYAYNTSMHFYK